MSQPKEIGGYILAGGKSSRMRRDKALLELGGSPLVVRTARLVESVTGAPPTAVGDVAACQRLGLQAIGDDWPGAGPLGGIATALRASESAWNLVVACDLPYLTRAWLDYAIGRALVSSENAVVAMNVQGAEPLCAVYHRRCEPTIREALDRGMRKVNEVLKSIRVEFVQPTEWKAFDSEGLLFKNMNSPGDYEEARARLDGQALPPEK